MWRKIKRLIKASIYPAFFLLSVVFVAVLFFAWKDYSSSGWNAIQDKYVFIGEMEYLESDHKLLIGINKDRAFFVKMRVNGLGIFLKPVHYDDENPLLSDQFLILYRPIFIPWADIKSCTQGPEVKEEKDIILSVKNINTELILNRWDMFKAICEKKGKIKPRL